MEWPEREERVEAAIAQGRFSEEEAHDLIRADLILRGRDRHTGQEA